MHNYIKTIFHLAHTWSKCVVSEFSEIMLHKWYFCKLLMVNRQRGNGISVADKVEILKPLSRCKTSICKHPASHPYSQVEKEYYSYDGPLNIVGMVDDKQLCLCSEDITVFHLATGILEEIHATFSCNSFTLCKLTYCSCHYMPVTYQRIY